MAGSAVPRFDTVTMDCPDPGALARFYAELLEWPAPDGDLSGSHVAIDPPEGGTALTFQRDPDFVAPTWPDPGVAQQMHLDLWVEDLDAGHERAVALGARHLRSTETFRVFADPVGHLFCLCHW